MLRGRPSLHGALVFAPDLAAAQTFYCDVLGFEMHGSGETWLELGGADFALTVFACETSTVPDGHSQRAGSTLALAVTDLESEAARLRGLGVTVLHEQPASGPIGRYVAFCDPFGTVHELVEAAR